MRQTSKRAIKSSLPIPVVTPRSAAASRPAPASKAPDSKADKSSQTGKVSEGKSAGNAKSQATTNSS